MLCSNVHPRARANAACANARHYTPRLAHSALRQENIVCGAVARSRRSFSVRQQAYWKLFSAIVYSISTAPDNGIIM